MPSLILLMVTYAPLEKDGNQVLPVVLQKQVLVSKERSERTGWAL